MTGKENIFLNGAILGMRKNEITRKLDEIIDFSGVERYIDTPVKRYSSGMYVRLAFAVAAHLESEILIVDEVLAVGDAEFQKKCLGKMGEVSKGEGRTVLFVSHNLLAVKSLCQTSILLQHGELLKFDETSEVIKYYNEQNNVKFGDLRYYPNVDSILKTAFFEKNKFERFNEIVFNLVYNFDNITNDLMISFDILSSDNFVINSHRFYLKQLEIKDFKIMKCLFPPNVLNIGNYFVNLYIFDSTGKIVEKHIEILQFEIFENERFESFYGKINGCINIPMNYKFE